MEDTVGILGILGGMGSGVVSGVWVSAGMGIYAGAVAGIAVTGLAMGAIVITGLGVMKLSDADRRWNWDDCEKKVMELVVKTLKESHEQIQDAFTSNFNDLLDKQMKEWEEHRIARDDRDETREAANILKQAKENSRHVREQIRDSVADEPRWIAGPEDLHEVWVDVFRADEDLNDPNAELKEHPEENRPGEQRTGGHAEETAGAELHRER